MKAGSDGVGGVRAIAIGLSVILSLLMGEAGDLLGMAPARRVDWRRRIDWRFAVEIKSLMTQPLHCTALNSRLPARAGDAAAWADAQVEMFV